VEKSGQTADINDKRPSRGFWELRGHLAAYHRNVLTTDCGKRMISNIPLTDVWWITVDIGQ